MRPIRLGAGGRSPILEFLSTRVLAPTDHCAVIELSTYVFETLREDGAAGRGTSIVVHVLINF
jgi:hypothetical protein